MSRCVYPLNGHLTCFQLWAIVNNAGRNMGVELNFQEHVRSYGYIPRVYMVWI